MLANDSRYQIDRQSTSFCCPIVAVAIAAFVGTLTKNKQVKMTFKEITTDQEWSEAIELRNIYNWSNPISVREERSFYERSKQDRNDVRLVGKTGCTVDSYACVMFNRNAGDGSYWLGVYLDPHSDGAKARGQESVEECQRRIREFGGTKGIVESRCEYTWERELFIEMGFALEVTLPFSCIEVSGTSFGLDPDVITFGEFLRENPEDGLRQIWRLEMDVASDLPLPYPFVETPFETYSKFITDPVVDLESKFLFVEGDELKGLSQLWPSQVNPTLAATGLTGVRRQYRRQGVATRTKQHAIAWASSQGIERIFTDNEENNPMYQLNLQLGFRHLFNYEVYSKAC